MESGLGVLVAVGAGGVGDGTLDLVAAEALRRGTGVQVLHVVHSMVVLPPQTGQTTSIDLTLQRVGRDVLADAAARLRPRLEERVPLRTELLAGPVATTIADCSRGRDLVVLERREPDRLGHLLTMSVSTRVAAHAHVPVVVVPRGWSPADRELPVTVGVDQPVDPVGQAEVAAAYAAETGRPLTVLHALWLAEAYQDAAFVHHTRRQWTAEADSALWRGLRKLDGTGAEITHHVSWARPVDALVAASRRSTILVMSRRPGRHGAHLGPVTRTELRHAECPVMVVDRA